MSFRYSVPLPSEFETCEEYEKAVMLYEFAMDDYCDQYIEDSRMR